MNKLLTSISIALFFFSTFPLSAQTIHLSGAVIGANDSEPLPFAYVIVSDANVATVTDGDGNFKIDISGKHKDRNLQFTYLGYKDKEIPIAELINQKEIVIKLDPSALNLGEVTIVSKKKIISPKSLMKKVIKNIENNYPQDTFQLDGYYRETVKENGAYIKFADGPIAYRGMPYINQNYRWKDYSSLYTLTPGAALSTGSFLANRGLHRIHFHHRTLKGDQVKILQARSSESLSQRNTNPSIEGGPLSLFARDQMKFLEAFTGKKKFRDFDYTVEEDNIKGRAVYILKFRTSTQKSKLDELGEILKRNPRSRKQWLRANNRKLLQGQMIVDRSSYAVLEYNCSVPNELKDYFCGYKYEDFKHFDYKVSAKYIEHDGRYYLDYIRHEDEFLILDSIEQSRTPYAAVSEFQRRSIIPSSVKKIPNEELFLNTIGNAFHEYALDYDSLYWSIYESEEPLAIIEDVIRENMEQEKTLEQQFKDKHLRDEDMPAPIAKVIPSKTKIHGTNLSDDYAWLKKARHANRDTAIMNYINAENAFSENYFRPLRKNERGIFKELVAHVKKDDESLPVNDNGYTYYSRIFDGDDHPIYYRHPVGQKEKEEILLDVNKMAKGHDYYSAGGIQVSPNNKVMAYGENTTGSDQYVLKFKNLETGEALMDSINNPSGGLWIDNRTMLYTVMDKVSLRSYQLKKHVLGTPPSQDQLIYEELDPEYDITISKSFSKEIIFLSTSASSKRSSEHSFTNISDTTFNFKVIHPRTVKHVYRVDHYNDQFYILTNKDGENNAIYTATTSDYKRKDWKRLIPHSKEIIIDGFTPFENHLVISEQIQLDNRIRIIDRTSQEDHVIKFKKDIHNVSVSSNPDRNTDSLRIRYSSPTEPSIIYDYHMRTKEMKEIKKDKPYPFLWLRSLKIERIWASAPDGTMIPMTVMYNKWRINQKKTDRPINTYMTSYGAYGSSSSGSGYDPMALALVNRGFVYVVAHVRGGSDLGYDWYEDGKMFNKMNTFTDFIACAEHLISINLAQKGRITAQGGSAGGLLMGAIANMRPELFKSIVLDVPFVDVINTMLDDKLPLTTGEYSEWGNPNIKKQFNYMLSYSPYENVKAQSYPNMLFYTALNDTRVGYWEPAKMVAKLRAIKTDDNVLLLHTRIHGGHSGGSGRYAGYQQLAQQYALIEEMYNKDAVTKE